jgi:hypothetical protein
MCFNLYSTFSPGACYAEKSMETMEKSIETMEKSMNTMEKSMNTM